MQSKVRDSFEPQCAHWSPRMNINSRRLRCAQRDWRLGVSLMDLLVQFALSAASFERCLAACVPRFDLCGCFSHAAALCGHELSPARSLEVRSEEHTSVLQSRHYLGCRLL